MIEAPKTGIILGGPPHVAEELNSTVCHTAECTYNAACRSLKQPASFLG